VPLGSKKSKRIGFKLETRTTVPLGASKPLIDADTITLKCVAP